MAAVSKCLTLILVYFHSVLFKDVIDTPSRKKRSLSHREEGETTETFVAQMTVFDKNRYGFLFTF